jgi:hypothetical protein
MKKLKHSTVMNSHVADARDVEGAGHAQTHILTGDLTLLDTDGVLQFIDPNGASRIITLPAESIANHPYRIVHIGTASTLTVKDDAGNIISLVDHGSIGSFYPNGTAWYGSLTSTTSTLTVPLLTNGGFEICQRKFTGSPVTFPVTTTATRAHDRWLNTRTGTDTLSVDDDTVNVKPSNSAHAAVCIYVKGTGTATTYGQTLKVSDGYVGLRGQVISYRESVKLQAGVANAIVAYIKTDGTGGTTTISTAHGNNTNWEDLDVPNVTVPIDATYVEVGVMFLNSCTAYLDNCCLVPGKSSSEYTQPHPAVELQLCERYYQKIGNVVGALAYSNYSTAGGIAYDLPITFRSMAVIPTPSINGTWAIVGLAGQPTIAYVAINNCVMLVTKDGAAGTWYVACNGTDDCIILEANP